MAISCKGQLLLSPELVLELLLHFQFAELVSLHQLIYEHLAHLSYWRLKTGKETPIGRSVSKVQRRN